MANITYYLGAGASFYAIPIQKELPEKMLQLATLFLPEDEQDFQYDLLSADGFKQVLKYMGYFGNKANAYQSIDSYAKYLWRNSHGRQSPEIDYLKIILSYFFTIWMRCTNQHWKNKRPFEAIDHRIMYLISRVIDDQTNRLKNNIRFVTWNYDLQIEAAFINYVDDANWSNIGDFLKIFEDQVEDINSIEVCHLNGFHGFITTPSGVRTQIHGSENEIPEYVYDDCLGPVSRFFRDQIYTRIEFAWDNDELSLKRREVASKIFSKTEHLVIIGYSFPDFNADVDKMLFKCLRKSSKITIHSTTMSLEDIKTLAPHIDHKNIQVIKEHPEVYPIPRD